MWESIASIGSSIIGGISGYFITKTNADAAVEMNKIYVRYQAWQAGEKKESQSRTLIILGVFLIVIGYAIYVYKTKK